MFSIKISAAGMVRSRLSEPGRVAESMLAKISLVICTSNNGGAESWLIKKSGFSKVLAMASIFSACKRDVEAELGVSRATGRGRREPGHPSRSQTLGEQSKRWKWKRH